jgi:hypothetical protein
MEKQTKLISGQENVLYFKLKTGYAEGARTPKKRKPVKKESMFNGVILRKAA